jgi:hypothetical protein
MENSDEPKKDGPMCRIVRPFGELSAAERKAMPKEEWDAVPPEEKRSCHDCRYLTAAVSWWCGNQEAVKARGTSIPGVCLCPYWEAKPILKPARSWWRKIFCRTNNVDIPLQRK